MSFEVPIQLKRADGPVTAKVRFGGFEDAARIQNWTAFHAEGMVSSANEASKYARDSIQRWQEHLDNGCAIQSPDDFSKLRADKPDDDWAMLLVVEATWWNDLVAFAYLRRTWTGSLYMEYLAKHPLTANKGQPDLHVSGVTEGILVGLSCLIESMEPEARPAWVWWESTKGACGSYERFFAPTTPRELVIISEKELAGCRCRIQHESWPDKQLPKLVG